MLVINLPIWLPLCAVQFFFAGLVGLFANYVNLRAKGVIEQGLYRYLIVDRPGRTLSSVLALVAACAAAVGVGGLEDMKLTTVVAAGFTSGWAIDAGVNKASC